jgi:hypothetical protein
MRRFISALVAVIAIGSAVSGTSSLNGPGTGQYYDFIKHQRPLRLDIAPTMLARADDLSNSKR